MKFISSLLSAFLLFTIQVSAQGAEDIVKWEVSMGDSDVPGVRKLIAKASVEEGWHIFGQEPGDEFLIPTRFTFENTSIKVISIKEVGTLKKENIPDVGNVQYYEKEVSFEIEIRSTKDTFNGSIEFQVCNATMCLPPTEVAFIVTNK